MKKDQPDFSEEFKQAVTEWRKRHGLREDDAVLLCIELFQIHQKHWDQIRHHDLPAFSEFRESLQKLGETAAGLRLDATALIDQLRDYQRSPGLKVPLITLVTVILACFLVGLLFGRFLR